MAHLDELVSLTEDRWEASVDSHLVVRETPPWKVRERWAKILLRRHELELKKELNILYQAEHCDINCNELLPAHPSKLVTKWDAVLNLLGTIFCRLTHCPATFAPGDHISVCPICGRKYILPWGDCSQVDDDVYVPSDLPVAPKERTMQAICRNGQFGDC